MKEYWRNPEATAETMTDDGYLRTGDLGSIDDDGYVTITGRKKDIIITAGGKNLTPANLEGDLRAVAVDLPGGDVRRPQAVPGGDDHARPRGDRARGPQEQRPDRPTWRRWPSTTSCGR